MNVAQRPVVVATAAQALERARRVVGVPRPPVERGVEQPDVEAIRRARRIVRTQVLRNAPASEALPVDRDAVGLELDRRRPLAREMRHVGRQRELTRDPTGRVVIARHEEDRDPRLLETPDLAYEEEPRMMVLPVAVVEVSRQEQEGHLLLQRQVDQIPERRTRGRTDVLRGRILVALEPAQGAVEVDVGGVQEPERAQRSSKKTGGRTGARPVERAVRSV
jgi:hypothetical protein